MPECQGARALARNCVQNGSGHALGKRWEGRRGAEEARHNTTLEVSSAWSRTVHSTAAAKAAQPDMHPMSSRTDDDRRVFALSWSLWLPSGFFPRALAPLSFLLSLAPHSLVPWGLTTSSRFNWTHPQPSPASSGSAMPPQSASARAHSTYYIVGILHCTLYRLCSWVHGAVAPRHRLNEFAARASWHSVRLLPHGCDAATVLCCAMLCDGYCATVCFVFCGGGGGEKGLGRVDLEKARRTDRRDQDNKELQQVNWPASPEPPGLSCAEIGRGPGSFGSQGPQALKGRTRGAAETRVR